MHKRFLSSSIILSNFLLLHIHRDERHFRFANIKQQKRPHGSHNKSRYETNVGFFIFPSLFTQVIFRW